MKRRNFLKTLLAAPAIPLVGNAVAEAEPLPPLQVLDPATEPIHMPHFTVLTTGTHHYPYGNTVGISSEISGGDGTMELKAYTHTEAHNIYSERRYTLFQTFDQSLCPGDIVGISDGGFAKHYEPTDRSGPVGVVLVVEDKGHPDSLCLVAMDEQLVREWND
jgi:hypothetical protein